MVSTHVMRRHVGVQNNGKMSFTFCIIIESNSQKTFVAIVLYTNMAAVPSREKPRIPNVLMVASLKFFYINAISTD